MRSKIYIIAASALLHSALLHSAACFGEIYKWVDQDGRVHYGDKRHAKANKITTGDGSFELDKSGQTLTLHAVADAELREDARQARGTLPVLSVGSQTYRNSSRSIRGLIKFDSSALLGLLQKSNKRLASATLELTLNGSNGSNYNDTKNAFFIIPSHNRWDENAVNWQTYYEKQSVPYPIRKLPFMTAPSSSSVSNPLYQIDALPLVKALAQNNMREVTLELKLQHASAISEIHFHAREAGLETSPKLRIEFLDTE